MESNQPTNDTRIVYIRDKNGVYFVDPLKDKSTKLLTVNNASVIKYSGNFTGV